MARVIVGSYMVRYPLGGMMSWIMQYLIGFRQLGHDVYFVEKSGWADSCYDPDRDVMTDDCGAYGTRAVASLLGRFGMADRWCYVDAGGTYHGLPREQVERVFDSAELFVDMGTYGTWLGEAARTGLRILIDGDPAFTQMKMANALEAGETLPEYDVYYTAGPNVGTDRCNAPTAGRQWRWLFHPVAVDLFEPRPTPRDAPFTTVMNWQSCEPIDYDGTTYGHKDMEFSRFIDLPRRAACPLEVALSGRDVPRDRLIEAGWRLRDAHEATISFDSFLQYIAGSRGEFSVCKNVYVATNSGWFSDRSAAYLASGRPVVMQDTGFSEHLPCGEGLFAVRDVDEAAEALARIDADHERHCRRAREIAETHLDTRRIIAGLVEELGIEQPSPMHAPRNSSSESLRIIVLGYIVRCPLGGMAWHYLQYVLGLRQLGHDVYFVEDSEDHERCCYDPTRHVVDSDPTYGLQFTAETFERVGLGDRWAYHDAHAARWHGPCADGILDICRDAELVLNISGANPIRPWVEQAPRRVMIDTDPVFEQVRQLTVPDRRELALMHNVFLSFGENLDGGAARVPDDGLPWRATRQPVVLDQWPVTPGPANAKLTTVMQWESYEPREYGGVRYGLKRESFTPYLDLPARVGPIFELALGSSSAPGDELRARGWEVRDPLEVTRDPWTYQRFIQASRGEFSIAKHGYVEGHTGWFSERSAAYLASGRPVLAQDTGFTDWLPAGEGLLAFTCPDEAVAGIESLDRRYEHHCRAARAVAETHFDARTVLGRVIDLAAAAPETPTIPAIDRDGAGGVG